MSNHSMTTRTGAPTDADPDGLVARCRAGDADGFGELVARTEPGIRRLLGRLVGPAGDLDDLVQETYLRAWRALPRFRGESLPSTWLFRIAANAAITWRKGRARARAGRLPDDDGRSIAGPAVVDEAAIHSAYGLALDALPPDLRAVFVLHEAEGLTYREVAEALGCPIGTVMSRLHRARTKILDALRDRIEELSP